MKSKLTFSVCMSVYRNDRAEFFRDALLSVIYQTVKPAEIVLVVDGPVPDGIERVISDTRKIWPLLNVIRLEKNHRLAFARQTGIDYAVSDVIALMDSDDISLPDRFEKQLPCFEEDDQLAVLGGQINEFTGEESNLTGCRTVALDDGEIKSVLKWRCPLNHMTVMIRKSALMKAGGYQDWFYNEDYYLWIRMAEAGCKFRNLPHVLVHVRVDDGVYRRRGGLRYFRSEAGIQRYMWRRGIIRFPRYAFNVAVRFVVQVVCPNRVRRFLFVNLFRERI
ncbi:MAG: glycosyltransferase [Tannerellaceae bacterium]|jgi:glycosyltransferase involved in cell wall biosynthesis|nr:glycosyltransferase [Tannerellaceae bacterium]